MLKCNLCHSPLVQMEGKKYWHLCYCKSPQYLNTKTMIKTFNVDPMGKPRMVRSDAWKGRDCVNRYWAFKDTVRAEMGDWELPEFGASITFHIPMPKSWSKKKKLEMKGQPHRQKPDIDNLAKSLFDSLLDDDSKIHDIHLRKIWSDEGLITIE